MKREIKFRAWNIEDSEMFVNVHRQHDWNILNAESFYELINDKNIILMQYTGLKDKNGKDIYDGDILSQSEQTKPTTNNKKSSKILGNHNQIVIFHEGAFKVRKSSKSKRYNLTGLLVIRNGLGVIGNIYENPELLK